MDNNVRLIRVIFMLGIACAIFFLMLIGFSGRTFQPRSHPRLNLAESSEAVPGHYERGVVLLSLGHDNLWYGRGADRVSNLHLKFYLRLRGEELREMGQRPMLQLRISKDAPARYIRHAAQIAEGLGYERLLIATHRPEA